MLPSGGVKKALLTYRKAVFWRWPREDSTRDADVPGGSSLGPVLPASGVKKVENGR